MTKRVERSFYRKSRSNGIVKLVREQYIRSDIPCHIVHCNTCHNEEQSVMLDPTASHYIIPDLSVIMRYHEILEQDEITGLIIAQTITSSLEQYDKPKMYRKLRQLVNDRRKYSIIFYNDNFDQTSILRFPGETIHQYHWRCLYTMANWYYLHCQVQQQNKKIILLSELFNQSDLPDHLTTHITVLPIRDYLDLYYPDHSLLHSLVQVLADVTLEDDMDRIKMGSKTNASSATHLGYFEYKSMDELEVGIKSGRFFSGILHCRSDSNQAYVRVGNNKDILVIGNDDRNRSVHGDMVVVELLSENNWSTPSNEITFGNNEDDDQVMPTNQSTTKTTCPTGRVVGVLNRNWRSYVATIQQDENSGGAFHLAIPLDSVIPKIRIRYQDVKLIENQRIVVRIDNWPVSSQYPNGHFVRSLGPIHQLDSEISAILVEHGISVSQASQGFSEASLKEMPQDSPTQPWAPTIDQIEKRKDLRSLTVFSIDPPNCQDIDDALSIRDLQNGKIELGVHIADVTYFVKENYVTDLEARARGTTVYLADRRFDMLPSVLSERVCSLRENVDRYAVSVLWTLDASYNIIDTWFGRSIIRSSCEMEYEQAQQFLDGNITATGLDKYRSDKLRPSVHQLAKVLRVFKQRRIEKGALELESTEVKFKMGDNNKVNDIIPKDALEIHGLVAEAMILANAAVGKRIYEGYKHAALLRRHPPPAQHKFQSLIKAAESRGYTIDFSSNRALALSLDQIVQENSNDVDMIRLMKTMATYAMNEAGYISSGHFSVEEYFHYGLALEFYTHFTSPIRRYADVVAHRQLLMCIKDATAIESSKLEGTTSAMYDDAKVAEICDNLNLKSRESKFAQRDSTELFQSLYVLQKTADDTPLLENGTICEIRTNGFYVYVPSLGLKGPVFLLDKDGNAIVPMSLISGKNKKDDEYIANCTIESNHPTQISVQSPHLPHPIKFNLFDQVRVQLKLRKSHAHRHMVYMTLVDFQQQTHQKQHQQLSTKELIHTIKNHEENNNSNVKATAKDSQFVPTKAEVETRRMLKKNKGNNKSSMYSILEQFRKLAIIENKTQ
ncbi:hypothetical protein BJ944DRAFT_262892 [Cunninghamella echinulata]|nr:hypothetical protein BJ944DRAFT_262892 [Cunninghamella echinulata]